MELFSENCFEGWPFAIIATLIGSFWLYFLLWAYERLEKKEDQAKQQGWGAFSLN